MSYSSPQLMKFDGQSQVVFLSDEGLTAFDTHTGQQLWQYEAKAPNWRATQPRQVGATGLIFGTEDQGLVRLEIKHSGDNWSAEQRWISKAMKPAYNDFVELDGSIYGFDGGIVGCVDAETGKRRWRGGRYGHGQMILLADQQLLLVISETGEVVLLRAQPEKLEELGRLPAITGKTWNHPTIVQGKLYVRNDEEMACYALPTIDGK
jgi:outer membrane protein assembly factor BamB